MVGIFELNIICGMWIFNVYEFGPENFLFLFGKQIGRSSRRIIFQCLPAFVKRFSATAYNKWDILEVGLKKYAGLILRVAKYKKGVSSRQ